MYAHQFDSRMSERMNNSIVPIASLFFWLFVYTSITKLQSQTQYYSLIHYFAYFNRFSEVIFPCSFYICNAKAAAVGTNNGRNRTRILERIHSNNKKNRQNINTEWLHWIACRGKLINMFYIYFHSNTAYWINKPISRKTCIFINEIKIFKIDIFTSLIVKLILKGNGTQKRMS